MTKKKYIDTYKTVYGIDLVVANKNVTMKDLRKKYIGVNDTELEDSEHTIASTIYAKNIATNRYTIIVKYDGDSVVKDVDKKLDLINTAAHEATHVVMFLYDFIGEKVFPQDSNELLANHIGWVTECIYKTWTKK